MPRIHTVQSNRFVAMLSVAMLLLSGTANAYIDLAPTLSKIITDSKTISLVEVTSFDRAKHEVSLKEVRSLKGDPATQPTVHDVSEGEGASIPRPILQWAAPGSQAVMFASRATSLVCIGQAWYQVRSAGTSGWKLSADRPDLPLAYYGSLSKLSQSVEQMLAGKDAVLTVVAFGVENEGASFDLALNRQSLPGLVRVQRIRANLSMPSTVASASANPSYFLGAGWVGEAEVPQLIERLKSSDALTRADAAEDLRTLGHKASSATQALTTLLSDATPRVRFVAAAALLQINPSDARPLQVLADGLNSTDAPVRAMAARLTGLSGAAAAPLASKLGALLKDSDESIRITAIQAISTLGKAASSAEPAVEPLLDDPVLAIDAADALGRIGVSAQPALKRLAKMLESDQPSFRWAAVRAMSQIGGPDAHPAVDFMITVLPKATEVEGYNMMIYLSLLGPVATDALPTLHNTAIKNPVLPTATEWAMAPEKNFPWLSGGRGGRGGRGGGPSGADGRGPGGPDGRGPGGPGGGPGAGGPGGPGGPGGGGFGIGAGGPGGGGMGGGDIFAFVYQSYVHELGDRLRPAAKVLATKIMDNTAGEVPAWGYDILACGPEESLAVLVPHLADDDMAMRERATIALSYMGAAAKPAKPQLLAALQKSPSDREKRLIQWALSKVERE